MKFTIMEVSEASFHLHRDGIFIASFLHKDDAEFVLHHLELRDAQKRERERLEGLENES